MASSPTAAASTITRLGSCLCKAVRFKITGPPIQTIICHCINCQKTSGSAFKANILYRKDQYHLLNNSPTSSTANTPLKTFVDKDTDSGNVLHRRFCGDCGSDLSITNETEPRMKDKIVVAAGSLDDGFVDFVPKRELFVKRRHAWLGDGLVEMEKEKERKPKM